MWIWIANKFAKFHAKRLNWSENIPKSFRGEATVLKHPVHLITDISTWNSIRRALRWICSGIRGTTDEGLFVVAIPYKNFGMVEWVVLKL